MHVASPQDSQARESLAAFRAGRHLTGIRDRLFNSQLLAKGPTVGDAQILYGKHL